LAPDDEILPERRAVEPDAVAGLERLGGASSAGVAGPASGVSRFRILPTI